MFIVMLWEDDWFSHVLFCILSPFRDYELEKGPILGTEIYNEDFKIDHIDSPDGLKTIPLLQFCLNYFISFGTPAFL